MSYRLALAGLLVATLLAGMFTVPHRRERIRVLGYVGEGLALVRSRSH